MTTATAPAPVKPKPATTNIWAIVAAVWHGVLGIGLILFGLLALFGATDVFGIVQLPVLKSLDNFFIRLVTFVICIALGSVQLYYWSGLRAYHSRSRVMSLVINFLGFLGFLSLTFRQMTCIHPDTCAPEPIIWDRIGAWLPFLVAMLVFGVLAYGMWRQNTAVLYGETTRLRKALTAYLYISPYLLTAAIFTLGLLIYAFALSFTDYGDANMYGDAAPNLILFENYSKAFQDSKFLISISNILWYVFIVVGFQTVIALGLALMMNGRFRGRRWFRTLFYAPSVTSSVVISLIFLWLFNGRGIVNYVLFESLQLTEPLGNLGLRTPNTNWLNTPTRLGDLVYLKPFFDGSWNWLLFLPLLLVIIMMTVRVSLWIRDKTLNRRAVLFAGLAAVGVALILITLLGLLPGGATPAEGEAVGIQGDVALKVLLITFGLGLAGGLVVNFLELEEDLDTATRSAVLGVLIAMVLATPLVLLFGAVAAPESFVATAESHLSIFTLLVLPLVVGPLTAGMSSNLSHRLFMPEEEGQLRILKPSPGGNMARRLDRWVSWMGTGLLVILAVWCVLVVLAAATTNGMVEPRDLGSEEFGALLLRGPSVAFMIIMLLNIFTTSPTFMIMFLAALQDVPVHLYEAAQIDGANRRAQFWNVTIPMLRPVILLIVVLGTIGTFQIFDQVHVMTSGGPLDTSLTPVYLIFTKAIGDQRVGEMGYAAALAFILGAIIFAITYIQRNYIEEGTEQY